VHDNQISFKIARALEHLESVKDCVADDIATYTHGLRKAEGKETLDLPEPSPLISIFVGDFLYQLRSTLDHLAFDIVKANRSRDILPVDWEERCQFPIWSDPLKSGETIPLANGRFKNLPGIPHGAHAIIESVQPYYPPNSRPTAANTSLGLLNKLSNIDKHRRLALTRTRAKFYDQIVYKSGFTGESVVTLDHGAEVPAPYCGEYDSVVDVQRSVTYIVAFNERALGDATTVAVDDLLQMIMDGIMLNVVAPLKPYLS